MLLKKYLLCVIVTATLIAKTYPQDEFEKIRQETQLIHQATLITHFSITTIGQEKYEIRKSQDTTFILIESKFQAGLTFSTDFLAIHEFDQNWNFKKFYIKGKINDKKYEIKSALENGYLNITCEQQRQAMAAPLNFITFRFSLIPLSLVAFKKYSFKEKEKQKFYAAYLLDIFSYSEFSITPYFLEYDREDKMIHKSKEYQLQRFYISTPDSGAYVWFDENGYPVAILSFLGLAMDENYKKGQIEFLEKIKQRKHIPSQKIIQEEVSFQSGKIKLCGTLTKPQNKQPPFPAVILVSGSGPQDRDECSPNLQFDPVFKGLSEPVFKPFRTIAEFLSENGFAVLRYDDRGVGKSKGNYSKATLDDFANDVISAFKFLKTREDIDKDKIFLIGHSEGSLHSVIAVSKINPAGIVLMGGALKSGKQTLINQTCFPLKESEISLDKIERISQNALEFYQSVEADDKEKLKKYSQEYQRLEATGGKNWLKSFIRFNMLEQIKNVKCPIFIVHGEKDTQVYKHEVDAVVDALVKSEHKAFKVKMLPDLNHLFIESETGWWGEYLRQCGEGKSLDKKFLECVLRWLNENIRRRY